MLSYLLIIFLLVSLSCVFALLEASLLYMPSKVRATSDEVGLFSKILDYPEKYLPSLQGGVLFTRLSAASYAAAAFRERLSGLFYENINFISYKTFNIITLILLIILISYFTFILGELLPKRIAERHAEKIIRSFKSLIVLFSVLFAPLIKIAEVIDGIICKLLGINPKSANGNITEEEIRMLVDAGEETGSIDETEKEMINNIFEFDNKTVDDIAVHRKDIAAIPVTSGWDDIIKVSLTDKFSRIPVYDGNIDNITGVLHLKDLLTYIITQNQDFIKSHKIDLNNITRKPYFVPLSKKTDALFEDMRNGRIHMAVVVDEYGGTVGIVTMEDLIEEIMGNIYDEYDEKEEPDIAPIFDNAYIIKGSTELEAVAEFFSCELPIDEYDTVSGFIVGQIGRIPNDGEQPEFIYGDLIFKVYEVFEMRVLLAVVCKIEE